MDFILLCKIKNSLLSKNNLQMHKKELKKRTNKMVRNKQKQKLDFIKNKKNILKILPIIILIITPTIFSNCGSTWQIKENNINILNKKNDTTKEQMGEISQKTMEPKIKYTEGIIQ